jgi:hypothetical protein
LIYIHKEYGDGSPEGEARGMKAGDVPTSGAVGGKAKIGRDQRIRCPNR